MTQLQPPALSEVNNKPRGKPSSDGPFLWMSQAAMERITNELGQTQAAYAIAVYASLCRLSAKAENDPRVRATVSKVAGLARLGYRKTFEVLQSLATTARVISIEHAERVKGEVVQPPCTYVLLACRLHDGKSARLHDRKSGRLSNGKSADCIRRTPSHAEIPKETFPEGGRKESISATESGLESSTQPQVADTGKKVTPFTAVEDWEVK